LNYQNNYVGRLNWLLEYFLQHCHQAIYIIILMIQTKLFSDLHLAEFLF